LLSEHEALLQELQNLLPDLAGRWQKLQPQILLLMTADTSTIAVRLLQLKMWFPEANVSTMVSQRYSLGTHILCNAVAIEIFAHDSPYGNTPPATVHNWHINYAHIAGLPWFLMKSSKEFLLPSK